MFDDPRLQTVIRSLREYVGSPSLAHIRDPDQLRRYAYTLLQCLDGHDSPDARWRKWHTARDRLIRRASDCWLPLEDLLEVLNGLPGPPLTEADVMGRLLALWDEGLDEPDKALREGCEQVYAREKAAGTEFAAIIEVMRDWMGEEAGRRITARWDEQTRKKAEALEAARELFMSGADCRWTSLDASKDVHCRVNGRVYRLTRGGDKKLELYRLRTLDEVPGRLVGRYTGRPDATAAVQQIAHSPEPRR